MKIDKKSIEKITGKSDTVLVYGLKSCGYHNLTDALNRLGITAIEHGTYPDKLNHAELRDYLCKLSDPREPNNRCKGILTYHLANNYFRIKNGMPIIPIIFCIELDEIGHTEKIDIVRVIKNHDSIGGTTNAELKRIYKIYTDIPELRNLIDQTIHFVKLRQDKNKYNKDFYFIDKLTAPWLSQIWQDTWEEHLANRSHTHKPNPCQWREAVRMNLTMFNSMSIKATPDADIKHDMIARIAAADAERYNDALWNML